MFRLLLAALALLPAQALSQVSASSPNPNLLSKKDRVGWPAPETLVRDLRSRNQTIRARALALMGMSGTQIHSARDEGKSTMVPDEIRIAYATLANGDSQQAIIAIHSFAYQMVYAAVATEENGQWKRIGVFDCWGKYEHGDLLGGFIQVALWGSPLKPRMQLIVRTSGGGSGIYVQEETRYLLRAGQLHEVLHLISDKRLCVPTDPTRRCDIERRWFYRTYDSNEVAGVLVTATGHFRATEVSDELWNVRDLEQRYITRVTCTPMVLDSNTMRFKTTGNMHACSVPK